MQKKRLKIELQHLTGWLITAKPSTCIVHPIPQGVELPKPHEIHHNSAGI